MMIHSGRLELSEDEAYALLALAMTSGLKIDSESEKAVRKLADYCKSHSTNSHHKKKSADCELSEAG